jgi:hypothetical protein
MRVVSPTRRRIARLALLAALACALAGSTGCAALEMLGTMGQMLRPQAGAGGFVERESLDYPARHSAWRDRED